MAQDIFDNIVAQAIVKGLVDRTVLYIDSTHLKANANKNRYDMAATANSRADYWDALDAAMEEDRAAHGQEPLPEKGRQPVCRVEKETKLSRTDPRPATSCARANATGSFISITAPWMAGSAKTRSAFVSAFAQQRTGVTLEANSRACHCVNPELLAFWIDAKRTLAVQSNQPEQGRHATMLAQKSNGAGLCFTRDPRALVASVNETMAALKLGRAKTYELINSGTLESYLEGSSRKITWRSIEAYIERRLNEEAERRGRIA